MPKTDKKIIKGPSDLTLGNYCRLLENEENWCRLGLSNLITKRDFMEQLNEVREIRNDIMHFSPGGYPQEQIDMLEKFAKFLQKQI